MQNKTTREPNKSMLAVSRLGEGSTTPARRARRRRRCDVFRNDLARARERQAEVWADEIMDISDAELSTREAIRRARLRMQSRQWLAGKYNQQFADKPNQTQVNVGVQVVLSEAERVKLLERHERAMLANQGKSGDSAPTPP